jgi:predicted secreted protein
MNASAVTVATGHVFPVSLSTHAGTGFVWGLSHLTGPVVLVGMTLRPALSQLGGATVTTFTFFAARAGEAEVAFELIRPWGAGEVADKREFRIKVAAAADAAMAQAAGLDSFPALAFAECEGEHAGKVTLPSRHNCIAEYAVFPGEKAAGCVLKYGFPVYPLYAVLPPTESSGRIIARYMAQPPAGK